MPKPKLTAPVVATFWHAAVFETEGRQWLTCIGFDANDVRKQVADLKKLGPQWAKDNHFVRVSRIKVETID